MDVPSMRAMTTIDLTADELTDAIAACRAMSFKESERAKTMANPSMRESFEKAAQRYSALARRLESAGSKGRLGERVR